MMIQITPYRSEWPQEFASIGEHIRAALGETALCIDHIGSTAVPGLAAKDIIDVQITVNELSDAIEHRLLAAGYRASGEVWRVDHVPPGAPADEQQWVKMLFKSSEGDRPANIHVRIAGRLNQRYPLLFRDYLRTHTGAAQAYAQVKLTLAKYHPEDMDAYYDVKDPVCDIIMAGAQDWADTTDWEPSLSDC